MEFRTLRRSELDQWVEHCGGVFVNTGAPYFRRHYEYDPWRCLDSIFVAVEDGRILATVRVFHRNAYVGGRAVKMGGIGEVSTKPEARRQGLSGRLLNMAVDYMRDNGFEISSLGTGIHSHYEKVGFVRAPLEFASLRLDGEGEGSAEPVAPADILTLSGIYDLCAPSMDGAIVRDSDFYWQNWVAYEMKNPHMLKDSRGNTAGYVSYEVDGEALRLHEVMLLPGFEGKAMPLLCALRERNNLPIAATAPRCCFPEAPVDQHADDSLMVRLVRPFDTPHGRVDDSAALASLLSRGADLSTDSF